MSYIDSFEYSTSLQFLANLKNSEEEGNPVPQFRTSPDGFDFSVTLESSNLYLALEKYREQLDPKGGFVDYRKVLSMMKVDKPSKNETGLIKIDTSLRQSDTGVICYEQISVNI